MDEELKTAIEEGKTYPRTLIEELYATSYYLIRNFELSPFATDTSVEDLVTSLVESNKI